jgi:hypothetical protein
MPHRKTLAINSKSLSPAYRTHLPKSKQVCAKGTVTYGPWKESSEATIKGAPPFKEIHNPSFCSTVFSLQDAKIPRHHFPRKLVGGTSAPPSVATQKTDSSIFFYSLISSRPPVKVACGADPAVSFKRIPYKNRKF